MSAGVEDMVLACDDTIMESSDVMLGIDENEDESVKLCCPTCGGCNIHYDRERFDMDSIKCHDCGTILPHLVLSDLPIPTFERDYVGGYKRIVHITERCSAHNMVEPTIPMEDCKVIFQYHPELLDLDLEYRAHYWSYRGKAFVKKDIQRLLRFIDSHDGVHPHYHPTKKFCRLYLEKWKSISYQLVSLSGRKKQVHLYSPDELAQVRAIAKRLSNTWDRMQNPAYRTKEERQANWVFPERKHFPNINFVMQQIHKVLGLEHMNEDFPLPATWRKLLKYWVPLCKNTPGLEFMADIAEE